MSLCSRHRYGDNNVRRRVAGPLRELQLCVLTLPVDEHLSSLYDRLLSSVFVRSQRLLTQYGAAGLHVRTWGIVERPALASRQLCAPKGSLAWKAAPSRVMIWS